MKNLVLLLLVVSPLFIFGQVIESFPKDDNGKLSFTQVIDAKEASNEDLYVRAKYYCMDLFGSEQKAVLFEDKDLSMVITKGYQDIEVTAYGITRKVKMGYTLKLQSKGGSYIYEISNIYFRTYPNMQGEYTTPAEVMFDKANYFKRNGDPKTTEQAYRKATNSAIKNIENTLQASMRTSIFN